MTKLSGDPDLFDSDTIVAYSVEGAQEDSLEHVSPVEAIAAWLCDEDGYAEEDPAKLRALLDDQAPLTIVAWQRKPVEPDWLRHVADQIVELVADAVIEEFGPDDDNEWSERCLVTQRETQAPATTLVQGFLDRVGVYQCVDVARRTLLADEMWTMLSHYYMFVDPTTRED